MTVKSYSISGDCVYQKDGGKIEVSPEWNNRCGQRNRGLNLKGKKVKKYKKKSFLLM